MMRQTKHVLMLILVFAGLGLTTILLTHQGVKPSELVSPENYITHVRPWINQVYLDQSLENITAIKNNFLNFKGSDRSMGPAHLSLFLAFDAWERFLLNGDKQDIEQAIKHFSSAQDLLPELGAEIEGLENLLKQKNA